MSFSHTPPTPDPFAQARHLSEHHQLHHHHHYQQTQQQQGSSGLAVNPRESVCLNGHSNPWRMSCDVNLLAQQQAASQISSLSLVPAVHILHEAVAADTAREFPRARMLYTRALDLMFAGLRVETDPSRAAPIMEKINEYLSRVEMIADYLEKERLARSSKDAPCMLRSETDFVMLDSDEAPPPTRPPTLPPPAPLAAPAFLQPQLTYVDPFCYFMTLGLRKAAQRAELDPTPGLEHNDAREHWSITFDHNVNHRVTKFEFTDYAPKVFREIRRHFHKDTAQYIATLTESPLRGKRGEGKSGAFFYYSQDSSMVVKTIHPNEAAVLLDILFEYLQHMRSNPRSFLCRIFGLHKIHEEDGSDSMFLVMGNVLHSPTPLSTRFDLKGATVGRALSEKEKNTGDATFKDLDFMNRQQKLVLSEKKELFTNQLKTDCSFLEIHGLMDYSLLVGICPQTPIPLSPSSPSPSSFSGKVSRSNSGSSSSGGSQLAVVPNLILPYTETGEVNPAAVAVEGSLPSLHQPENAICFRSWSGHEVYYVGIIDILTKHGFKKRLELELKGLLNNKNELSCVEPDLYSRRLQEFMSRYVE